MSEQYSSDPALRKSLVERMRAGDMTVSNKEVAEVFKIDPHYDPYSVSLDSVDPAHPQTIPCGSILKG